MKHIKFLIEPQPKIYINNNIKKKEKKKSKWNKMKSLFVKKNQIIKKRNGIRIYEIQKHKTI